MVVKFSRTFWSVNFIYGYDFRYLGAERSYILKQTCSFYIQVWLSMYDILDLYNHSIPKFTDYKVANER